MRGQTRTRAWTLWFLMVGLVAISLFLMLQILQATAVINGEKEDAGNGVQGHGALHVEGVTLTDSHGKAVQLRGMSTHGIMWYPQYTNAGAFQTVREYGGNVVRLALYSDQNLGYVYNPEEATAALLMALENALSQDLYAIVDWHVLQDEDPNLHIDAALNLFTDVSKRYGNHPGILYEICNEPNNSASWESVTAYAQKVIPVIRQNAPDAVILVGTPNHCTDFSMPMEQPLPFKNIMYSFHQYTDTMDEDSYKRIISEALRRGLPLFVTEWGISNKTQNMEQALSTAETFLDYLDSQTISWINWSLCNKNERSAALSHEHDALSGWEKEDFSPSGQFVFNRLGQE